MDVMTILSIAGPTALVTGGVAWGSARQALNGTRERVKNLETKTIEQDKRQNEHGERLARIETKIDILINR